MPKKPSPKTQTTRRRGAPLTALEIIQSFAVAETAADNLAAKYLLVEASDEVFDEVNAIWLSMFAAVAARKRLTHR